MPYLAFANPFSLAALLAGFGTRADAAVVDTSNSQRMALLSPATNIDPNPNKGGGALAVEGGEALAAAMGPQGTVADVEEIPASSQISVYTVHAGDTLSQIAGMFGVSVNTIIWANDIKGGVIHEGDKLVILPVIGIRHTIAAGETLASVAKKFSGSADEIAQYNGLAAGSALKQGETIIIPNGEIPVVSKPATPAKKSSAVATKPRAYPQPALTGTGPSVAGFAWPVAGGQLTQSLHGWNGVDIGAPRGTGIMASAGGTVIVARASGYNGGYGSYVVISHPNGTQTLYAHMSRVSVSAGQSVAQGAVIGAVGNSGKSTGTHLHFETRGARNPFAN